MDRIKIVEALTKSRRAWDVSGRLDMVEVVDEALAELDNASHVRYVRQGPPIQMQDVLLACGELNERERVAVQWLLDKVKELTQQAEKAAAGLTVEEAETCMDEVGDPPDNPDHFWQWREKVSALLAAAMEAKQKPLPIGRT